MGKWRGCERARISHLRLGALVLQQPDEAGDGLGAPLDEFDARRVVVERDVGGGDALGFVEGHLRLQSVLDEVELELLVRVVDEEPVSYTHLTLPTIYSV